MKIYLSGASHETERAMIRGFRDKLLAAGHTLTHDWIPSVDHYAAIGKTDRDLTAEERHRFALSDVKGVLEADVVWLLVPKEPKSSIGCWVELGVVLALREIQPTVYRPPVIVSGNCRASIFCDLASELYETHELALDALMGAAR